MSPASHMVGRLRKPHGIVLGRMRSLNERPTHRPLGHGRTTPHCIVEQLEPRLLLSGTLVAALTVDYSFDFYVTSSDSVAGTFAGHKDTNRSEVHLTFADCALARRNRLSADGGVKRMLLPVVTGGKRITTARN